MPNHRTLKQQRARKTMIAAVAAAGVSGAFVLAQSTDVVDHLLIDLTSHSTVIGIGGRGDATSANIPAKLSGTLVPNTTPPPTYYVPILYPASLDLNGSRNAGVIALDQALNNSGNTDPVSVVGYSEGTLVAEQEKRNLQAANPGPKSPYDPNFTQIASPFIGNGGVFARFPETPTFLIVDNMGPAQPTKYDTKYVTNEYDPYGDFPAYANPLSLANSLLAVEYAHPDQYYNVIQPGLGGTQQLGTTKTATNSAGGIDTYTLYYNPDLPLLGPIRQLSSAVGATQFTEPALDLFEPTLRVLVDMGYTDRTNADPATPTPFSLITPPQNIIGAAAALPGAIAGGIGKAGTDLGGISPLGAPSPAPALIQNAPAQNKQAAELPAPKPVTPTVPKLPKLLPNLLPLNTLSQTEQPAEETPPADSATVTPPKKQRTLTPNLGTLLGVNAKHSDEPAVGGAGTTTAGQTKPSFGGGHGAGVVSGALKNISDALKPKAATP